MPNWYMLPWLLRDTEPKVVWMPHCLRECLSFSGTERHPQPQEPGTLTWKTYVTCLSRQLVQAICTLHSGLTTKIISYIWLFMVLCHSLPLLLFFFFACMRRMLKYHLSLSSYYILSLSSYLLYFGFQTDF